MTNKVIQMPVPVLRGAAEKATQTTMDTLEITRETIKGWKHPPFQRPLRENEKIRTLAVKIKDDGGVIPGVITLGVLDSSIYIVDGQHRLHGATISEAQTFYADVRTHHFSTMAEMGEEFVRLNSSLVRMRPDDILRGLEASIPGLQRIRKRCPFVGYDQIRRGDRSPIVSMSMILRMWWGSGNEVPDPSGVSSATIAQSITETEIDTLISFLTCAMEAWGRDPEYQRLWGSINLILCAWLYRRVVLGVGASAVTTKLTHDQFRKCLMGLSTDSRYLDWLVGRQLGDRDRSPAYHRIKTRFSQRLHEDTGKKPRLPGPAWASHSGGRRGGTL